MKMLPQVTASAEQLPLISQNRLGVEVICGAAGSGKTSTALLRLRSLCYAAAARNEREGRHEPVQILVLAFNRTLSGYIAALAEFQIEKSENVELHIDTFSRWAINKLKQPNVDHDRATRKLKSLAQNITQLAPNYVIKEVEYLLGRFLPEDLENYITIERTGRGILPRVDRNLRRKILDAVVYPYRAWLIEQGVLDWNEVSIMASKTAPEIEYDIVIVDESQDFSANQLRAIRHHLAEDFYLTFIIDTVQRIYARGFTWAEAGIDVRPERSHTLTTNHRNTVEIARFAASILNGIGVEGDGALPNLRSAVRSGKTPYMIEGNYIEQVQWALNFIRNEIDLRTESVAFLKPLGGKWFNQIRLLLKQHNFAFIDITREDRWSTGPENIVISTFHSAKGLEFDHVFILGLNYENTPHAEDEIDDQRTVLQRLLAMAVARARNTVVLGYKKDEASSLIRLISPETYQKICIC